MAAHLVADGSARYCEVIRRYNMLHPQSTGQKGECEPFISFADLTMLDASVPAIAFR